MVNPKYRNWCFTINNYTPGEVEVLQNLDEGVKYLICGKEIAPTTGTPHLQGYIVFPNRVRVGHVKTFVGNRARIVPANGDALQNYEYCTKEGEWWEHGTRPATPKEKGEKEKARYKRAWTLACGGDLETLADESPDIVVRHYNTLKRIKHDKILERELQDTVEPMLWYYGASGTGKSRKARTDHPNAYLKNCNKWWDGYVDQDVVLVEDFDKKHEVLIHHMKIWSDRYPFNAEVKGSTIKIRPRQLIVTSNYRPQDIWTAASDLEPILRRFKILEFRSGEEPREI